MPPRPEVMVPRWESSELFPHVPPANHPWVSLSTKTPRERDAPCRTWEFHVDATLPDGGTLPVYVTLSDALLRELD